jgi:RNA polymerase sigma-70 factor (ECF subfamily)
VIDHVRRSRREAVVVALDQPAEARPSADEVLIRQEDRLRLQLALDRLPSDYQEVIRLRLLLSLPTVTVAAWLGRSEGAVRVLLHRAVQALRRELGVSHD